MGQSSSESSIPGEYGTGLGLVLSRRRLLRTRPIPGSTSTSPAAPRPVRAPRSRAGTGPCSRSGADNRRLDPGAAGRPACGIQGLKPDLWPAISRHGHPAELLVARRCRSDDLDDRGRRPMSCRPLPAFDPARSPDAPTCPCRAILDRLADGVAGLHDRDCARHRSPRGHRSRERRPASRDVASVAQGRRGPRLVDVRPPRPALDLSSGSPPLISGSERASAHERGLHRAWGQDGARAPGMR